MLLGTAVSEARPDADDILIRCRNCGHIEDFHAHGVDTWCLALNCGCGAWDPATIVADLTAGAAPAYALLHEREEPSPPSFRFRCGQASQAPRLRCRLARQERAEALQGLPRGLHARLGRAGEGQQVHEGVLGLHQASVATWLDDVASAPRAVTAPSTWGPKTM